MERKFKTYFISSEKEIESKELVNHFDYPHQKRLSTSDFIPKKDKVKIIITSGASCPDAVLERVLRKVLSYFPDAKSEEEAMHFVH